VIVAAPNWDWGLGIGVIGLALIMVLVVALLLGGLSWRRDPHLRRIRFGVFLDRDRFEDEPELPLDRGFDDDERFG